MKILTPGEQQDRGLNAHKTKAYWVNEWTSKSKKITPNPLGSYMTITTEVNAQNSQTTPRRKILCPPTMQPIKHRTIHFLKLTYVFLLFSTGTARFHFENIFF